MIFFNPRASLLLIVLLSFFSLNHCQACCGANKISVQGDATVKIAPDLATLVISFSQNGKTSSIALQNLNKKINAVIAVIIKFNIPSNDYFTQNLNIFPQFDFSSGQAVLIGQTATQSISVTIRSFTADGAKIGQFIDAISLVNGINFNGVSFDTSNKAAANQQARKAAFNNARNKAIQYASLSSVNLNNILKISDVNSVNYIVGFKQVGIASADVKTSVPVQSVSVSASVNVDWSFA